MGAGSGKQVAKIASGPGQTRWLRVVRRDEERSLLDALPVRRLWGIGPVAEEKLHRLGIETVGQFAALADAEAASILGATVGPALHRLARGIDDRPVVERAEAKQISAESTFAVDLTTLDQLQDAGGPIAEHAHKRLERDGRGARTVTVKLKKSDMSTLTRSATLPYATADAATLIATARRLLLDPVQRSGRFACWGWASPGLSDVRQESLFPDLDQGQVELSDTRVPVPGARTGGGRLAHRRRRLPSRVRPRLGPGRGPRRDDGALRDPRQRPGRHADLSRRRADLTRANPVDSLDWPRLRRRAGERSAAAGEDVGHG